MSPELKAKWVSALRSGAYQQGHGTLRRGDAFCCIGVLCDVSGLGEWAGSESEKDAYILLEDWMGGAIDDKHLKKFGLAAVTQERLIRMNDGRTEDPNVDQPKCSFDEIADYIEAHV